MIKNKGFTLIEILIVIGLLVLLAAAALPVYGNFQVSAQLNENSSQIVQALRMAREKSMAGFNNSRHGVKFASDRYIIYQGESYDLRDSAYDREVILNDSLSISTSLNNNEINFGQDLGRPDNTGTTTLIHALGGLRRISVNDFGMVD